VARRAGTDQTVRPRLAYAGAVLDDIPVRTRRSARARRVRLRMDECGLEVVLPLGASESRARAAVAEHEAWIQRTWARIGARPGLAAGTSLWRGEPVQSAPPEQEQIRVAKGELVRAVAEWSGRMELWPKRVQVRDQRSKWGACTARGTVTLNWRLIKAPPEVLEYVVVHELAHLREMNHSPRFWATVEAFCPEWRRCRDWLRRHGHLLAG
jgi:predicted metal-dependent hydrolase